MMAVVLDLRLSAMGSRREVLTTSCQRWDIDDTVSMTELQCPQMDVQVRSVDGRCFVVLEKGDAEVRMERKGEEILN